jgi:hypothetical protein
MEKNLVPLEVFWAWAEWVLRKSLHPLKNWVLCKTKHSSCLHQMVILKIKVRVMKSFERHPSNSTTLTTMVFYYNLLYNSWSPFKNPLSWLFQRLEPSKDTVSKGLKYPMKSLQQKFQPKISLKYWGRYFKEILGWNFANLFGSFKGAPQNSN